MRRNAAIILLITMFLSACSARSRQIAITSLNVTASAANASADSVLEALCLSELAAINHRGRLEAGRCIRTDEPRAANALELSALAQTRARWAPVRQAYEAFASVHDEARRAVDAQVPVNQLDAILARLTAVYRALRAAAEPFGVVIPVLNGGQL